MKYRADIDGLRAIAIVLVLLYHGGLSLFPSGFIGVDVFFVISGFLITSIIHADLNNQHFSFLDFYNRRLWRLQPVLICLILVTTVLTLIWFLPEDLIEFSRSARKTSLFISNEYFNKTTTGYFSPDSHQLPLLHTWSLSIEWQCYLILPIVMYCLHKLFKNRGAAVLIYVFTGLFFLLTLRNSQQLPAQTYYQFTSRIFEFLIGSSIAVGPRIGSRLDKRLLNALGLMALLLIFYIASLQGILLGFPNCYAFAVCVATGLLLSLGDHSPTLFVTRALSIKPVVFIGVLSYSLYIWHWAVFSMFNYQSIAPTPTAMISAYSLTFVAAYCSWRYIEKPSRQYKRLPFRYTFVLLLVVPVLLAHLSWYVFKMHEGYPQRFNSELVAVYNQLQKFDSKDRPLCISNDKTDIAQHCRIGAQQEISMHALMIGDSFSNHYWGFMDALGKQAGLSTLVQGTSSCLTLPGIYLYDWGVFKNQIHQECYDKTASYYKMIQENRYDYVILGQVWRNYFSDHIINQLGETRSIDLSKQRIRVALEKALNIITQSGAVPVIIKSTAIPDIKAHDCFFKHVKLRQKYVSKECRFNLVLTEGEVWFNHLLDELLIQYPKLIVIDPKSVQCGKKYCYSDLNGIPVYRDEGHITDYASYQLGKLYSQKMGNPFAGSAPTYI